MTTCTNKFKDILIVSDIDGTLLGSDNIIPKRNIEKIKYFIKNGGYFAIASARDTFAADRFYKELDIKIPCILCNGAMIFDFNKDKFISSEFLKPSAIECVRDIKEKFPDVGIKMVCEKELFYINKTKYTDYFDKKYNLTYKLKNVDEIPQNTNKIVFISEENVQNKIMDYIKTNPIYFDFNISPTEKFLLEMMAEGVTKGQGLKKLEKYLNLKGEKTYAIGDYYNDMEMFQVAANSVTVKNAPDDVKAVCDLVMGDFNLGAVADLIEYIEQHYNFEG